MGCVQDYLNDKYKIYTKATNNPGGCLSNDSLSQLIGWFDGDSMNISNNVWENKSGSKRDFIGGDDGIIKNAKDLEKVLETNSSKKLYLNGHPIVYGSQDTQITFGPIVSSEFTVINLCKYIDGSNGRILAGKITNTWFGHGWSQAGTASINGLNYITDNVDSFGTNWVLSSVRPDLYKGNGINLTMTSQYLSSFVDRLVINTQGSPGIKIPFACAEIIMINRMVSDDEIQCMENYLAQKYKLFASKSLVYTIYADVSTYNNLLIQFLC